jgi:hypothetical protein
VSVTDVTHPHGQVEEVQPIIEKPVGASVQIVQDVGLTDLNSGHRAIAVQSEGNAFVRFKRRFVLVIGRVIPNACFAQQRFALRVKSDELLNPTPRSKIASSLVGVGGGAFLGFAMTGIVHLIPKTL